jgi:hypothetical protein
VKSESVRDRKDTRARDIEPLSPVLGRRTVMYKDGRSAVQIQYSFLMISFFWKRFAFVFF